jgi:hypothetical protein
MGRDKPHIIGLNHPPRETPTVPTLVTEHNTGTVLALNPFLPSGDTSLLATSGSSGTQSRRV